MSIGVGLEVSLAPENDRWCPTCGDDTVVRVGPFTTCGGLTHPIHRYCKTCDAMWLPTNADLREYKRTNPVPEDSSGKNLSKSTSAVPSGPWRLASSGVSLDAGDIRIRLEGGTLEERQALAAFLLAAAPREGR